MLLLSHQETIPQLVKAVRTLRSDTSGWKNPCRSEYLKELGRIYLVYGNGGVFDPEMCDIVIAEKLRLVGFSCNSIYRVILEESPIVASISDTRDKTSYLELIKSRIVNPKMARMRKNFYQWRKQQAINILNTNERDAFIAEIRLDELGLATEAPNCS